MGQAKLVNNNKSKQKYWKDSWKKYYPDKNRNYKLIKFTTEVLELIDIPNGLTGNKKTWAPERVTFQ